MCEEKTENEKPRQNPGVDFVVTREQLELVDVNRSLAEVDGVGWVTVRCCLSKLKRERPEEQSPALGLLHQLTSLTFYPGDPTEPFKPLWEMGGERGPVPTDLLEEQINVIAEFAPTVDHLGLRARLSDVSWFVQRKRRDMAEMAVAAYCDSVEAVRDGNATFPGESSAWGVGAKEALTRAACISYATGWKLPTSERVRTLLAELLESAHQDCRSDDFWRIAGVDLDHKIYPLDKLATMAEGLARGEKLANEPETRHRLLELSARAYRCAQDEDNANRCMVDVAECYVQEADLANSPMLEAHFLHTAIQTLRNHPNTQERRKQLNGRLLNVQPGISDEMQRFSVNIGLTESVEQSVDDVRGRSWREAFLSLVQCDQPPTPDEIRKTVVDDAQEFSVLNIMPIEVLDFQGRVVFRTSGMGGDSKAQEENLRYQMARMRSRARKITVSRVINPIRKTMAAEHPVSNEAILELLHESHFIPLGHEYIYVRAICHFLGGKDIEAVSLLTPQLENLLRHILMLGGHDTTTADENGIQTEASLSILLNPRNPWRAFLEKIISARYIHEIDLLFNFAGGPSVRNQVAHGKIVAGKFSDCDFVYAAWLIIHLVILSTLNWRVRKEGG